MIILDECAKKKLGSGGFFSPRRNVNPPKLFH